MTFATQPWGAIAAPLFIGPLRSRDFAVFFVGAILICVSLAFHYQIANLAMQRHYDLRGAREVTDLSRVRHIELAA